MIDGDWNIVPEDGAEFALFAIATVVLVVAVWWLN
jgi:hypothetical protein